VNAQESQQKFKEADSLFRSGQFEQALSVLDELNRAFPNTKNILYPAALCLERLGRSRDALNLCEQLISQHKDSRAVAIKDRLATTQVQRSEEETSLAALNLHGAADILDMEPAQGVSGYKPVETERDWKKFATIGLGAMLLVAFIVLPPLLYEAPPDSAGSVERPVGPITSREDLEAAIGWGTVVTFMLALFAGNVTGGYIALMILNQLPSDEFKDNLISISATAILMGLANSIPFVGFIIALVNCGEDLRPRLWRTVCVCVFLRIHVGDLCDCAFVHIVGALNRRRARIRLPEAVFPLAGPDHRPVTLQGCCGVGH